MNVKHGMYGTPVYKSWQSMLRRGRGRIRQEYYADRGIGVCERWEDFAAFYVDMGERPEGMSLDRIDNDKGYEPGNCRWATRSQQCQNKSDNLNVTFSGETLCVTEWARRLSMNVATIRDRLERGWPTEKALSTEMFHHQKGRRPWKHI